MKIRNRITLFISGAALLATLLFSIVIFLELVEQPFDLMDRELRSQAHIVFAGLSLQSDPSSSNPDIPRLHSLGRLYWFKVFDHQQNIVYASSMTRFVDIPLRANERHYNINARVPSEVINLGFHLSDNAPFRVIISRLSFDGREYLIQIAKPMERLWDEIVELVVSCIIGLIFSTLFLVLIAYFVAGKILQPLSTINNLIQEISSKTLDKRIPLGKNQDELHTLSLSLNQMFDRLQFSFKRQKEFVANASHELKTPIALQRLFFDETIQRDDLPGDFRTKLAIQSEITLRMNQLVKNLLDLSTLELNETIALQPVDLTELATAIFKEFDEIIQAAGIKLLLDLEDGVHLQADKEKIRRVMINLIDNAIKYNLEDGGEILFSLRREDNDIKMLMSNTGLPISEGDLKQVYNQFYRVEKSRSIALGGSGLGLTIVKRIVELHRGEIMIENQCDGGVNHILVKVSLPQRS